MQNTSKGFKAVVLFRSKKNGNIISRVSKKTFSTSHEAIEKALLLNIQGTKQRIIRSNPGN